MDSIGLPGELPASQQLVNKNLNVSEEIKKIEGVFAKKPILLSVSTGEESPSEAQMPKKEIFRVQSNKFFPVEEEDLSILNDFVLLNVKKQAGGQKTGSLRLEENPDMERVFLVESKEIEGEHLDLGWVEVKAPSCSGGEAIDDLEHFIATPEKYIDFMEHLDEAGNPYKFGIDDRIRFCEQLQEGIENLHSAGYCHGDVKPENCLVYWNENEHRFDLKITDFGRAQKVKPGFDYDYKGNTRFAPPEGGVTKEGDLYGVGIIFMRILEEDVIETGEHIVEVSKAKQEFTKANDNRRGVDAYITNHKDFTSAVENKGVMTGRVKNANRRNSMKSTSLENRKLQSTLLKQYNNQLFNKFLDKYPTDFNLLKLGKKINFMIDVDPAKRAKAEQLSNPPPRPVPPLTSTIPCPSENLNLKELGQSENLVNEILTTEKTYLIGLLDAIHLGIRFSRSENEEVKKFGDRILTVFMPIKEASEKFIQEFEEGKNPYASYQDYASKHQTVTVDCEHFRKIAEELVMEDKRLFHDETPVEDLPFSSAILAGFPDFNYLEVRARIVLPAQRVGRHGLFVKGLSEVAGKLKGDEESGHNEIKIQLDQTLKHVSQLNELVAGNSPLEKFNLQELGVKSAFGEELNKSVTKVKKQINEIIDTERSYLEKLKKAKALGKKCEENDDADIKAFGEKIVAVFTPLEEASVKFIQEFKDGNNPYATYGDYAKKYQNIDKDYKALLDMAGNLTRKKKRSDPIRPLQKLINSELSKDYMIGSLLIEPVQRIMRHPMITQDLLKEIKAEDSEKHSIVTEQIAQTVQHINTVNGQLLK